MAQAWSEGCGRKWPESKVSWAWSLVRFKENRRPGVWGVVTGIAPEPLC